MTTYEDEMREHDEEWDSIDTPERTGDFGPQMPDGQHQALLVEASVRQRQSDEHFQLYFKFTNKRGTARKWSDLDHEVGASIAKGDLLMLGWVDEETGKVLPRSRLKEACESGRFDNLVCNINVKTKPGDTRDFTDVYLNGVVGVASNPDNFKPELTNVEDGGNQFVPTGGADFPAAADDDIPF